MNLSRNATGETTSSSEENPRDLSCKKDNYIEISKKLDCFGSGEPLNDDTNSVILSESERSHNRENITNNAILRGLNCYSPQKDGKNCEVYKTRRKATFTEPSRGMSVAKVEQTSAETLSFRCVCERCRLTRGEVSNKNRKVAFTLAEVLITLGIIGVVAAITLPTLVANYKKQVYVTQLKKSVSTWEQGFQKMLADDGVDSLQDTEVFKKVNGTMCDLNSSLTDCQAFYDALGKYIKITNLSTVGDVNYKYSYIKKGSSPIAAGYSYSKLIFVNDGSMAGKFRFRKTPETPSFSCEQIAKKGGKMCEVMGQIAIDVNGLKGPNIEGRDLFNFNISGNGLLIPFYSESQSIYIYGNTSYSWENQSKACGTKGKADAVTVAQYGSGCAARIIANGWKMDY